MNAELTRERLLFAAIEIFAVQGYEGASTRDICNAAGISNASIHYHFGDKAAIYRELFVRLLDDFEQRLRGCGMEQRRGREALLAYYDALLRPLADNAQLAQQIYLYVREEFQPTGVVDDLLPRGLQVQVELLGALLRRELCINKLDKPQQRLLLALHGIAFVYVVQRRTIEITLPSVLEGAQWISRVAGSLADTGWAMIEAERKRREAKH